MSKPNPNTKETPEELLEERGGTHGPFTGNALCTQTLKEILRGNFNPDNKEQFDNLMEGLLKSQPFFKKGWTRLHAMHRESLDMEMHKNARIMNGDHTFDDHWDDKAGYNGLPKKFNHGR